MISVLLTNRRGGGAWVQLLGGEGAHARAILVLCEYIWKVPAVSLVLPAYDDTGSLGFLRRQVVYTTGSTLVDSPSFLTGE